MSTENRFIEMIHEVVRDEVNKIIEEELKLYQAAVERRARARTAEICSRVAMRMNFEAIGMHEVRVTLNFKKE